MAFDRGALLESTVELPRFTSFYRSEALANAIDYMIGLVKTGL